MHVSAKSLIHPLAALLAKAATLPAVLLAKTAMLAAPLLAKAAALAAPLLMAASLLVAACDQHDDLLAPASSVADGSTIGTPSSDTDSLYFRIDIAIPAADSPATRATPLYNGSEDEYAVHDGIIALFTGDSEETATLLSGGAYQLKPADKPSDSELPTEKDPSSQITTHSYVLRTITTTDKNIYALVLLNNTSKGFSLKDPDSYGQGNLCFDSSELPSGTKIADIRAKTITKFATEYDGKTYYFMSNAPMRDRNSQETTQIEVTQLFKSDVDATRADATVVCVERACAKVSVEWSKLQLNNSSITINGNGTKAPIKLVNIRWVLDNKSEKAYALRNFNKTWLADTYKYDGSNRFSATIPIGDVLNRYYYRTLWGKEPDGNTKTQITASDITHQSGDVVYCLENLPQGPYTATNTPRVLVSVSMADESGVILPEGTTLYGISDEDTQMLFTTETACDAYCTAHSIEDSKKRTFPDGRMYYAIYINHFDADQLTATDQLGRYGLVRDHWYRIRLSAFNTLGYGTIGEIPAPTIPTE